MKHGTTPTLEVRIPITPEQVKSIAFAFREERRERSRNVLVKQFVNDEAGSVRYDADLGLWLIEFTEEETWMFTGGAVCYMDTRIVMADGRIPEMKILEVGRTDITFFPEDEVTGDGDCRC